MQILFLTLFFVVSLFCDIGLPPGSVVEELIKPYEIADRGEVQEEELDSSEKIESNPQKKWYFTLKPGYYYFTDSDMRQFFDDGGFIFKAETGCNVYGPLIVWLDAGYFQKTGHGIGGGQELEIKLATITLGLKVIYGSESFAVFAGAGPRLFMMLLHNDTPFVRSDDNAVGIGGGFDFGFRISPVKKWKNFYLELFADYSLKELKVEEDEISSFDNDVDVSGLSAGAGLGVKF